MYRIIKTDGTEIGICEDVQFIKINEYGTYVPAGEEEAVGIAFKGEAFNLIGHNDIEGADTAIFVKTDAGSVLAERISYAELEKAYREGVESA